MWSLSGMCERKFIRGVWGTWPRWPPHPYMVKPFKNIFLQNQRANDLVAWYVALEPWAHHNWFKGWPLVDRDLFYGKVKFGLLCFYMGKLLESHLMEETYSKWPEWQKVYIFIKILTPKGYLLLPRDYIHVLKHEKLCIKSDFLPLTGFIFLNLFDLLECLVM